LGGAVGVLVLALVGGLIVARRNRETADEFYPAQEAQVEEAELEERLEPEVSDDAEEFTDEEPEDFETEPDEFDSAEPMVDDDLDEEELEVSQTGDVIGEADIYIAYGRYPQAIGLLMSVLEDDPERNDVRLKLLELFVETNDSQAFESHMSEFVNRCDDEDALLAAREFEARLGENDLELGQAIDASADDGGVESELDELANVDDFDLDLDADSPDTFDSVALEESPADDDVMDLATEEISVESEVAESEAQTETEVEPELEADLTESVAEEDFELELDEIDDLAELAGGDLDETDEQDDEGGAGDQLGGDLGIDFNPDAEPEIAEAPEPAMATEEAADVALETMSAGTDAADAAVAADTMDDIEFESEVATIEEDEFEFEDEGDSANTKLDLARAYIDMGDEDGARDILKEVLDEGNTDQQQQAQSMLEGL
jgi:pilus assembly protein FimV